LYGPVLERRAKADKIRITLSILEQWRFFFNLASSLRDMIQRGRYDAAVRDYKKGKNMMLYSFWNEESKDGNYAATKFGKDSILLPKTYRSVFENLWSEVEKVVREFRDELFKSLRIMSNPVETQEKIIKYLASFA
jgi:exocyst complex component 2